MNSLEATQLSSFFHYKHESLPQINLLFSAGSSMLGKYLPWSYTTPTFKTEIEASHRAPAQSLRN